MGTPFIDSLSPSDRQTVGRSALLSRPAFIDDNGKPVQISEDMEALLILLPVGLRRGLIGFIDRSLALVANPDDLALMAEMVETRSANYKALHTNVVQPLIDYDVSRGKVNAFIQDKVKLTPQGQVSSVANTDVGSYVIDLGQLYSLLSASYAVFSTASDLATHDRITDAQTLLFYQTAGTDRQAQLTAWKNVINSYQKSN